MSDNSYEEMQKTINNLKKLIAKLEGENESLKLQIRTDKYGVKLADKFVRQIRNLLDNIRDEFWSDLNEDDY